MVLNRLENMIPESEYLKKYNKIINDYNILFNFYNIQKEYSYIII